MLLDAYIILIWAVLHSGIEVYKSKSGGVGRFGLAPDTLEN